MSLSTHVLDTASGCPAEGIKIQFFRIERKGSDEKKVFINEFMTNHDGRVDKPLLTPQETVIGRYELLFYAADYFEKLAIQLPDPPFIDQVSIRFGIAQADSHYHVPLLLSPWSYSTYRGS